jgi:hypothetical protein
VCLSLYRRALVCLLFFFVSLFFVFCFGFSIISFLMFYSGPFLCRENVHDIFPYKFAYIVNVPTSLHSVQYLPHQLVSIVSNYTKLFGPFSPLQYPSQPSSTSYTPYVFSPLVNFVIHLILAYRCLSYTLLTTDTFT